MAVVTMVQTTVDISHLNVAPTVLEVAAKTQETAKNLQQKTPVTPAVESIISLSLVVVSPLDGDTFQQSMYPLSESSIQQLELDTHEYNMVSEVSC